VANIGRRLEADAAKDLAARLRETSMMIQDRE
jgi:hypothetical protein